MNHIIAQIGWLLVVYLLGSIPFGLIVAKASKGVDPRLWGSKSTGATNVARTCGAGYGLLTFVLDAAKGFVPILLATAISTHALFLSLTGLAALVGHMYSIFLQRKGGKGVATSIGIFAALTPGPLVWSVLLCILLIWFTGYVSVGSLSLVASMPVFMLLAGDFAFIILGLLVMCLVFARHRDNILRLARGEEHPWRKDDFTQSDSQAGPS
jgi:glycerol-3-phosphate acyltransferase PlsY